VPPGLRPRLAVPLLLLLATPYLFFALHPGVPLAAAAAALASIGFGASLVQQERLVALTPDHLTGHVLGLQSAGTMTLQGVSAALAGTAAQVTSPGVAMTAMAGASLAVTGALTWAGRAGGRGLAPRTDVLDERGADGRGGERAAGAGSRG
ncbi:MFS transporter, partial [Streptomyces griseosporeus]